LKWRGKGRERERARREGRMGRRREVKWEEERGGDTLNINYV